MHKIKPFLFLILLCATVFIACKGDQNGADLKIEVSEKTDEKNNVQQAESGSRNSNSNGSNKSVSSNKLTESEGYKFWDFKKIFYKDLVGEVSKTVYENIKGQKYFDDTFVFVYATAEDMEGTFEYEKIEESMNTTLMDDRIFIWVHLKGDGSVKFVKTLISDNIKDKIDQGSLTL